MWLIDRSGYICYLFAIGIGMACWRNWLAPGWWVIAVVLLATGWYLNRKVEPDDSGYGALDVMDASCDVADTFEGFDLNFDVDVD